MRVVRGAGESRALTVAYRGVGEVIGEIAVTRRPTHEDTATATDPVIVAAYSLIARDEQRHAELAFRFVRWALASAPESVAPRITSAIASAPSNSLGARAVASPCLEALLSVSNLAV